MKKITKTNELYWVLGNVFCALGVALCTKAGLGMSMISAPAFILNQFLIKISPFFTQGACEYLFQALLLVLMCLISRRFKLKYLLSFGTAFISGNLIDFFLWLCGGQALYETMTLRILAFAASEILIAFAIACYFRTNLPLCVYELFIVAIAERFKVGPEKVKIFFDYGMLALSVILTLVFFGKFVGVGIGTVVITLVNAHIIKLWGKLLDKIAENTPLFPKLVETLKQ